MSTGRRVTALVLLGATGTALGALGLQHLPDRFAVDPTGAGKRALLLLVVLLLGLLAAATAAFGRQAVLATLLRPFLRCPRLAAAGVATLLSLLLAEGLLRLLPNRAAVQETRTGEQVQPDKALGYRPRPGGAARVVLRDRAGHVVTDATYHIGLDGRRVTPLPRAEGHRRTALLFGCSFAFGFGLSDGETIAAAWARAAPAERVHNLGCEGWGPHHALVLARQPGALPAALGEPSVAVFLWIDHHLDRIAGRFRVMSTFGIDAPCFELAPGGDPVLRGPFRTARPWRTLAFDVLQKSRLLGLAGFDWPPLQPGDHDLAAALLAALDAEVRTRGAHGLLVAVYPGEDPRGELAARLQARGVACVSLDGLFDPHRDGVALDPQGHPAAATAAQVGAALAAEVARRWP